MPQGARSARTTRRLLGAGLALTLVLLALAGLALVLTTTAGGVLPPWGLVALLICMAIGGLALWYGLEIGRWHFVQLERLRGTLVALAGDPSARLPLLEPGTLDLETARLHEALAALTARHAREQSRPDRRLQAVLASIPEAMVVITDEGQISLVNHAAKQLLGADEMAVGTSVYAALSRATLLAAVERAKAAGQPVDAMIGTLKEHQLTAKVASLGVLGGAVITIPAAEVAFRAELDADLALHDVLPTLPPVQGDTPLDRLPVLVLDTETTGLDVTGDRIVSVGAVRLVGGRIYRASSFDRLVRPGIGIPPRSTAVHGITDAMVAEAPPFAAIFAELSPLLEGTVLVGHHIGFDVAMLRRECLLAGCVWPEPPSLCTLLLAASLDKNLEDASLDALATQLGVSIHGRHTALGDSLVTAEVYTRLLALLADRGVTTLGQARAFGQQAKAVLNAQAQAGW